MSILKDLINSIGHFFENLFKTTQHAFNELPKEQQDAIISGVNLSQLIKDGYLKGETSLIGDVAEKLGVSTDVAKGLILHVLNSLGIEAIDIHGVNIQLGLDAFADRVQAIATDDGHNGLYESIAKFSASWLATGSLNWITLGLGVVEYAYQHFIKKVK